MEKPNYKPRILMILVIAVVIGQMLSVNYLKKDLDAKIAECSQAVNTCSILQGALVNILVEKKVLEREELLDNAQKLSKDLRDMVDRMKELEMQGRSRMPAGKNGPAE